jgi:hypothetical protein
MKLRRCENLKGVGPQHAKGNKEPIMDEPLWQARLELRFLTPAEGGRSHDIASGEYYSAPFFVGDRGFDCRLCIGGGLLELGSSYELGAVFLDPEAALPLLKPGTSVRLWEGKTIATGLVVAVNEG